MIAQVRTLRFEPGAPLHCTRCGFACEIGSIAACVMWPKGCRTMPGDRAPSVCWWCCTEDERVDLVDAGCHTAAMYLRYQSWPPRPQPPAPEGSPP